MFINLPVTMRVAPASSSAGTFALTNGLSNINVTSIVDVGPTVQNWNANVHVAAGLVAGQPCTMIDSGSANAYLYLTAEL